MKPSLIRLPSRFVLLVAVMAIFPAGASAAGGAVDAAFGSGGSAALPSSTPVISLGQDGTGNTFATQATTNGFQVTKLSPTGGALSGYGASGTSTFTSTSAFDASQTAVYPDGRVLVLGTACSQTCGPQALVRLNSDGEPDTTFGPGGVRALTLDPALTPAGLAISSDGSIVVAEGSDGSQKLITRLAPDGSTDTAFGSNGVFDLGLTSDAGPYDLTPTGLAVGPDGSILVSGYGNVMGTTPGGSGSCCAQATILKLGADGTPDSSFGTAGVAYVTSDGTRFDNLSVSSAGNIYASGTSGNLGSNPDPRVLVAKFSAAGTRDGYFGQVPAGFMVATDDSGLAVGPTGHVVITGEAGAGTGANYRAGWSLARLDTQGAPDPAYGHSGSVGGALTGAPSALIVDASDGALVAAAGTVTRYSATETPSPADTVDAVAGVNRANSLTITARSPEGPNTTIECSIDSGPWGGCPENVPADPGSHVARVRTHDASGALDPTPSVVPFDVGPIVSIRTAPGEHTSDSTPTFTFSSDTPNTTFQCFVGTYRYPTASDWTPCSGPAGSHTSGDLAAGPHTFYVRGVASGAVEQSPDAFSFTVDAALADPEPAPDPAATPPGGVAGVTAGSAGTLTLAVPRRVLPGTSTGWARTGLRATVRCSVGCHLSVRVEIDAKTEAALGLKSTVIASRTLRIGGGVAHAVTVRVNSAAFRALRAADAGTRIHPRITFDAAGSGQTARVSFH